MTPARTMTGAMTGATTEPRPHLRRFRLPPVSVRTRVTAVIAVLTFAAMSGAGVLVYMLESARIERVVNQQIDQEIAEFRLLQQRGVDPDTGERFDSVGRLLDVFLVRNVPDDDELLVGYAQGQQDQRTQHRYGELVLVDPTYERIVADLRPEGGTRVMQSPEFGEVWISVVPVRYATSADPAGALTIVNFLDDEHFELRRTMQTYAIVALLSLGLIMVIASSQSGRLLAPLREVRETAEEISATDLSRRIPERGNDDITALTRTVNGMLARLEAGFETQREFLDDAGHELRTPLTVLRGHLEVLDQDNPEDVAETKSLLLDELDRMARLVGDLTLLAKTRRPDFLATQPVGLEVLTETMLAKARVLADRVWLSDGVGTGTVVLDEQRITQAVLQLADNAVKHTDPGDIIAIGSSYDDGQGQGPGQVRLWVRDSGPGVPVAEREQIFERFGRGAARPADEGFGLGLSIVKAIAEAHDGRVAVDDAVGSGALFVITLPLTKEHPWPAS